MNIYQMHIEINQSLQQIASNRTRKYLSEEIDLVINKNIIRYIQDLIAKNIKGNSFEDNQVWLDSIRSLISIKTLPLNLFNNKDDNKLFAVLPSDYSFLVSDASYCINKCEKWTTKNYNESVVFLEQVFSPKNNPPYYENIQLKINNIILNIPSDLPLGNTYNAYPNKNDIFALIPFILRFFRNNGVQLYWEKYGNIYKKSTYIIPTNSASIDSSQYSMTIDGQLINDSLSFLPSINTRFIPMFNQDTIFSERRINGNLLIKSSESAFILTTPFYRPTYRNPVSQIFDNIIYVYTNKDFKASGVQLYYIRKPAEVSLKLGVDCDLPEEFHYTITDLSTTYIKNRINEINNWKLSSEDISTNVVI